MMSVSVCPKCQDEVRIPLGASEEATVSCPLCHEEFLLAEVLKDLPPLLEVVHDPQAETAPAEEELLGVDQENAEGAEAFSFNDAGAASVSKPGAKPTRRTTKRKSSVAVEIVKIVLGGVLGLAIAQLLLWWGWGKDPFGIGDKVGSYVPQIVPEKYRPKQIPSSDSKPDAGGQTAKAGPSRDSDDSPFLQPGDGFPQPGEGGQGSQGGESNSEGLSLGPEQDEQFPPPSGNASDDLKIPEVDLDPLTDLEPSPKSSQPVAPPKEVKPTTPEEEPLFGVRNAPSYQTSDLVEVLRKAMEANLAWDTADQPENRRKFYQSLANAADVVAVLNLEDAENQKHTTSLRKLVEQMVALPNKQELISGIGERWMDYPNRQTQGIALVGVVKDLKSEGRLYTTILEFSEGGQVAVVTHLNPQDYCQPMSRVLVLGRIVEDPQQNVVGFGGDAKRVVWGGMIVPFLR